MIRTRRSPILMKISENHHASDFNTFLNFYLDCLTVNLNMIEQKKPL